MRILHLLSSPVFSGPAEPVCLLAAAQRALGHDVKVAIDRKRLLVSSEELLLPRLEQSGLLDEGGLELCVKSSPLMSLRDIVKLRLRQVDVVHAHFTHDHVLARLGQPRHSRLVRSIHAPRSLGPLTPGCDAFTVPFEALLSRVGSRPAIVLPAMVDDLYRPAADRAALRAKLGLPMGQCVGMVSTFQQSRRHDLGIDAFALLRARKPLARLVLTGDGRGEAQIRARVLSVGLRDAITFTGYQRAEEFPLWIQALDEVWILGLGNDFSARAAAQARACGVRVVAVDEGALASYADAVVAPEPQAIADAALTLQRRALRVAPIPEIAQAVIALYRKVGAPS